MMNSPLAKPLLHEDALHTARGALGETLLLRFLVQRGIVHRSLLKLIEVERCGSGTSLSLVDWLVQRGHVSEETLTSVLAACLSLQPADLAPYALTQPTRPKSARRARHLKLVSSR